MSFEETPTPSRKNQQLDSAHHKESTWRSHMLAFIGIDESNETTTHHSVTRAVIIKLLWILIIIVGTYLTITMCLQLLYSYRYDPPYSQIIVKKKFSADLPFIKLCLPTFTKFYLQNEINTSYQDIVNNYLKGSTPVTAESFLGTDTWPGPFLYVVNQYLASLRDAQIYSGYNSFDVIKQGSSDEWQSFLLIEDFLTTSSITIDQLQQKFGRDIAQLSNMQSSLVWYDVDKEQNISFNSTIAVANDFVCLKSERLGPFDSNDLHYVDIEFNYTGLSLPDTTAEQQPIGVIAQLFDTVTFDIMATSMLDCYMGSTTSFRFKQAPAYRSLSEIHGVKKCSTTTQQENCRSECRADYIRKMCGCEPIAWPELAPNKTQYCSLQKMETCKLSPDVGFSNCSFSNSCLPYCTEAGYDASVSTNDYRKNAALIYIDVNSGSGTLYDEKWPWTTESFVGAFGGVLGLWLGLDVLIILNLILTPFECMARMYQRRSNKKKISSSAKVKKSEIYDFDMKEPEAFPPAPIVSFGKPFVMPADEDRSTLIKNKNEQGSEVLQKNRTRVNNIAKVFDIHPPERTCSSITRFAISKLLWIVIVVAGTYFTITMSLSLIDSYNNDPPYSKITVQDKYDLPFIQVCVPTYTLPYLTNEPQEANPNYDYDYLTSLISPDDFLKAANNYLNSSTPVTVESFLGPDDWPRPFLHVVNEYLSLLRDAEIYIGNDGFNDYKKQNATGEWQAFMMIEDYMNKSSITVDQLVQKFGADIKRLFKMQGKRIWNLNNTETPFNFNETIAVTYYQTCFKAEAPDSFDLLDSHSIEFSFDRTNAFDYNLPYSFRTIWFLYSIMNTPYYDVTGFASQELVFGTRKKVMLYMAGLFTSLPDVNGVKQCATTPHNIARAHCRGDYIRKRCECEPMAWPDVPSTLHTQGYCSLQELETCQLPPDDNFTNCSYPYPFPFSCSQGGYAATVVTTDLDEMLAKVTLEMQELPFFPLSEETWPWTFENFIGSLGGVLGLWLGLDILVIFHLLLTTCGFCCRVCCWAYDKKKSGSREEKREEFASY